MSPFWWSKPRTPCEVIKKLGHVLLNTVSCTTVVPMYTIPPNTTFMLTQRLECSQVALILTPSNICQINRHRSTVAFSLQAMNKNISKYLNFVTSMPHRLYAVVTTGGAHIVTAGIQ